jgi:hypothetical protein
VNLQLREKGYNIYRLSCDQECLVICICRPTCDPEKGSLQIQRRCCSNAAVSGPLTVTTKTTTLPFWSSLHQLGCPSIEASDLVYWVKGPRPECCILMDTLSWGPIIPAAGLTYTRITVQQEEIKHCGSLDQWVLGSRV